MEWLAFSIACVATIYFAIHYRGFRRGLMFVAGGLVALSAAWVIYFWHDDRQTEARRQIASKLIRPDQIGVLDAKLALGSFPQLNGTIINRSDHELAELAIKTVVSDCPRFAAKIDGKRWKLASLAPAPPVEPTAPAQNQDQKAAPNSDHEKPWERYKKEQDAKNGVGPGMFDDLLPRKASPSSGVVKLAIDGVGTVEIDDSFQSLGAEEQNVIVEDIAKQVKAGIKSSDQVEPQAKKLDAAQCGIVGEGVAHLYSIDVPKGQKRAFETHVTLPKLPEMKEWSWRYSIEEAIAKY